MWVSAIAGEGIAEILIGRRLPGDVNGDDRVDFADVLAILAAWGPFGVECPEDLDGDDLVGFADLLVVLTNWST